MLHDLHQIFIAIEWAKGCYKSTLIPHPQLAPQCKDLEHFIRAFSFAVGDRLNVISFSTVTYWQGSRPCAYDCY